MSCAKDLDIESQAALQGLLTSLRHANDDPSSGARLTAEQLGNLSEKINEILGDNATYDLTAGNLPSQLVDEDSLPIIDISEQVDEDSQTITSSSPVLDQDSISLFCLSPEEKERRRRERDRILELLEEEERLQQLQEEKDAEEERKETTRGRKESAKAELDRLRTVRELQKKMGRALVYHAKGTGDNGHEENAHSRFQVPSSAAKKSVSFASPSSVEADERVQQSSIRQPDWGDVTPGRLRARYSVPLESTPDAQKYPMKMHVVERHPMAFPISPSHKHADSDDESNSSAGRLTPLSENESPGVEVMSSSSDSCLPDEELLEEGFDYDTAQHHREIALEYHKKRHTIGMVARTLDGCERHETSSGQHFQTDCKSHSPVSPSIGETVIPASSHKSPPNSVRLGKLENDQLVGGGSGESGSEDEVVREAIQMLRTGGPAVVPPKEVKSPTVGTSTSTHGAKPSRFKLGASRGDTAAATFQEGSTVRSQPALSNVVERKTPRSTFSQHFPMNRPSPRRPVDVPPSIGSRSSRTIPSSHQMQVEHPSLMGASAMRDSMNADSSASVKRPISKFMAERREC